MEVVHKIVEFVNNHWLWFAVPIALLLGAIEMFNDNSEANRRSFEANRRFPKENTHQK
jgi:hypothetical protein